MPAEHTIDHEKKLITTVWFGDATDRDLIDSFKKYQQEIKGLPVYSSYNEILDLSNTSSFMLSADGIKRLAQLAVNTDVTGVRTRLAIIVNKPVAYGLARMYAAYRSLVSEKGKEVRVYMNHCDALEWLDNNADN
jgi:hypothetical protein